MDGTEQNLTPKQKKCIPAIISARTITEGVKQAGISKTLFYDWMKDDFFRREFIAQQNDLIETALKELKGLSSDAVLKLGELLRGTENESIRLKTIALILDNTLKLKELEDIEERLLKLEKGVSK